MNEITYTQFEWMVLIGIGVIFVFVLLLLVAYNESREREQFKEIVGVVEKRHLLNLTMSNMILLKVLHRREGTKETLKILTGVYHPQGAIPK